MTQIQQVFNLYLRGFDLLHGLAKPVDLLLLGKVALLGGVQLLGQLRPEVAVLLRVTIFSKI